MISWYLGVMGGFELVEAHDFGNDLIFVETLQRFEVDPWGLEFFLREAGARTVGARAVEARAIKARAVVLRWAGWCCSLISALGVAAVIVIAIVASITT